MRTGLAVLAAVMAIASPVWAQAAPDLPAVPVRPAEPAAAPSPEANPPRPAKPRPLGLMERLREESLAGDTLDSRIETAAAFPLGSRENPVRVDMPAGQRAYLDRLRCSNGKKPAYERVGNFGVGVFGSIIDGYQVVCPGKGEPKESMIFMDMYHPDHLETAPVPGFTIKPAPGEI